METTFTGDDASLEPVERLLVHIKGVQGLKAYNEGVLHAQSLPTPVYTPGVMATVLDSMQVIVDNAVKIAEDRNHQAKCLNISITALATATEEINKLHAELGLEQP